MGAIAVIAGTYIMGGLPYLAGTRNSSFLVVLFLITFFPVVGLGIVWIGCEFYRAIRPKEHRGPRQRLVVLCAGILSGLLFLGSYAFHRPWWVVHSYGLRTKVEQVELDRQLPAIREWIAQIENPDNVYPLLIPIDDCPPIIQRLCPRRVWLGLYGDDTIRGIRISWGGGFIGGWGITVGPASMQIPEPSDDEFVLPLGSGFYISHTTG